MAGPILRGLEDDNSQLPHESLGRIFYNELRKKDPKKIILIDYATKEEISYERFFKVCCRLAVALTKLGVKRGDVMTIVSENNWKYLATMISGFFMGVTVNPLNHDYTLTELKHFMTICPPTFVFCSKKTADITLKLKNETFPCVKNVIIYDEISSEEILKFDDLSESTIDNGFSPIDLIPNEETALLLTSSGTTGVPKCVMLSHSNIRITLLFYLKSMCIEHDETNLGYFPFFHIYGSAEIALTSILFGIQCVIFTKFHPEDFLKTIQDYNVTKLFVVPPILHFLIKHPSVAKYDLSSVREIFCGGAQIDEYVIKTVENQLKVVVRQTYGMTEVAGAATIVPNSIGTKINSVGTVAPTYRIKVCRVDSDKILPPNETGEIRIGGPGVTRGYLGTNIEDIFDGDGYFKTGDLGYYDEDGFLYIVARLKDLIRYKGFQVVPTALESLLLQHPAVKDVGVVGMPDERAGELPLAFIVKQPSSDVTEEEIVKFVEENISVQKRLYGGVRFVEQIPKTPSGKVLRRKLKELL